MKKALLQGAGLALAMAGVLVVSMPAHAMTIVPPSLEFSVQPGGTLKTEVKLFNESNEQTVLYPTTANFTAADESGTPSFDPKSEQVDLASWIKVDQTSYTLAPAQKMNAEVTINVPANADPGGHYAALFFGTQPPKGANGGSVAISSKIGVLVILRVEGNITEQAKLISWKVSGPTTSFTRPPVSFQALIQNTGNVHIRPQGTVAIHNMFGGLTDTEVFNSSRGAILPSSSRLFQITWAKNTDSKHGGFFHEVGAEWSNFALGTYTASLNLTYGSNSQSLLGDVRFSVFPWQLLLVIVILIIIIVLLLTIGLKRYNAMIIKRAERTMSKR